MVSRYDLVLAQKISTLRHALDIGSRELSADLGRGPNYISRIESGHQALSLEEIAKIASALETTPETLVRGVWRQAEGLPNGRGTGAEAEGRANSITGGT